MYSGLWTCRITEIKVPLTTATQYLPLCCGKVVATTIDTDRPTSAILTYKIPECLSDVYAGNKFSEQLDLHDICVSLTTLIKGL
jgi:hypothetical protein